MVFSSTTFLFFFMPIALGLYFILPWRKAKNVWLLVVSLVFYAWGEPVYVLLMLASIVGNWLFALGMGDRSDARCLEKNAAGGGFFTASA